MRSFIGAAFTLALFAGIPARAEAQMPDAARSLTWGISGGIALPQGEGADEVNNGWQAGISLGLRPAAMPFGLRFDAQYTRFGTDRFTEVVDGETFSAEANLGIVGLIANAVVGPSGVGLRPYFLAGVGLYNLRGDVEVTTPEFGTISFSDDENKFGLNGGIGIEFPLGNLGAFAEARYHTIFTEEERTSFIPITVGFRF